MCERLSDAVVAKLDRTEEHIEMFALAQRDFFANGAYTIHLDDPDPDSGIVVARIRVVEGTQVPGRIWTIVGDIAHNLRSALDIQVCDLLRAADQEVKNVHSFPISKRRCNDDDVESYEGWAERRGGDVTRKTAGVPESVAQAIRSELYKIETYGGSAYQVHQVNRLDKHQRLMLALGEGQWMRDITTADGEPAWVYTTFALTDGEICYRGPSPPPDEFFQARPWFVFDDPPCVSCLPVSIWAKEGLGEVRQICERLSRAASA